MGKVAAVLAAMQAIAGRNGRRKQAGVNALPGPNEIGASGI